MPPSTVNQRLVTSLPSDVPCFLVPQCEDELLQALALSVMPLDELHAEAAAELALNAGLGQSLSLAHEDLLVQKLLAWFKQRFFRWTDAPACGACSSSETKLESTQRPTPEEAEHDAGRWVGGRAGGVHFLAWAGGWVGEQGGHTFLPGQVGGLTSGHASIPSIQVGGRLGGQNPTHPCLIPRSFMHGMLWNSSMHNVRAYLEIEALQPSLSLLLPCRTEVYRCTACSNITRFPRYNDPGKLLETRCG